MAIGDHSRQQLTDRAYAHIVHLAGDIGPRGSCTQGEYEGTRYVASTLHDLGLSDVHTHEFSGAATAYGRYGLAFGVALLGQILAGLIQSGWSYIAAGVIFSLSAWAMFAESDFHPNWTHWLIRSRPSHNVIACCPARKTTESLVVISAHVDSHRTPFFNSNPTWQRWYNLGFRLIFLSMVTSATLAILAGVFDLTLLKIIFHALGLPLVFSLLAFLHADNTPFSPGAYDNASGVACTLTIAEHLIQNPLDNTDVWFAITGCEETGAGGMLALVNTMPESWRQALWVNLDQTGIGQLYIRLEEGMLRRYTVQPSAIQLARAAVKVSGINLREHTSQAFSDAIIAHQQGLLAISLGASPAEPGLETPRHQMSDVPAAIQPETLHQTLLYVWSLLAIWDKQEQRQ
ncbi:MAG: M20/M25/M40 family metallo-hydrolase [Anaerolineales bacterium]